jgi:hypothetical protein
MADGKLKSATGSLAASLSWRSFCVEICTDPIWCSGRLYGPSLLTSHLPSSLIPFFPSLRVLLSITSSPPWYLLIFSSLLSSPPPFHPSSASFLSPHLFLCILSSLSFHPFIPSIPYPHLLFSFPWSSFFRLISFFFLSPHILFFLTPPTYKFFLSLL